jgi:hypothetical protein
MRVSSILMALSIAVALLSITACASAPEPLQTEPDFLGFITGIEPGQITVESHADKIVDRYVVTINDGTAIFEQEGENLRYVSAAAFETKQWVRIWFSGPIIDSWPKLATAKQLVIERAEIKPADEPPESKPPEPTEPGIVE